MGGAQAVAATPESGSLSSSTTRFAWTGEVTASWAFRNASDITGDDTVACEAPYCDSVTLNVAEGGDYLMVGADTPAPASDTAIVTIRIHHPNGEMTQETGESSEGSPFTVKVDKAEKGEYTIDYLNSYVDGPINYNGNASLGVPLFEPEGGDVVEAPPAPPAPPAPAPQPAPQPAPAPAPAPAALTLDLKAPVLSARKLKRSKSFSIPVKVSRGVATITATLLKGKTVVASGKLGSTSDAGKLVVRGKKAMKAGRYTLTLTAVDGSGVATSRTVAVKIKR
jgi:hypothetical protein